MEDQAAIGVFDSGLGGLTVLHALRQALPHENFVYLGDVARLPYGTKSPTVVTRYARSCLHFLSRRSLKACVIACNTASALALDELKDSVEFPVFGVIEPGALALIEAGIGNVLVLATEATVRSEAYPQALYRLNPDIRVQQVACPLLVTLAEQGWFDHSITRQVFDIYLQSARSGWEAILLGCTHYPLLLPSLRPVIEDRVPVLHGANALALALKANLLGRGVLREHGRGQCEFLSTDVVSASLPLVQSLFPDARQFEIVSL